MYLILSFKFLTQILNFFSFLKYQVVSDKQLVKHLQKEVARLEAELRTPEPANEKDWKIQQVHQR